MKVLNRYLLQILGESDYQIRFLENVGLTGMPLDLIKNITGPGYLTSINDSMCWTNILGSTVSTGQVVIDFKGGYLQTLRFDSSGRLIEEVEEGRESGKRSLIYDYWSNGHVSSIKYILDGKITSTEFYETNGNLLQRSQAGGIDFKLHYDSAGRLAYTHGHLSREDYVYGVGSVEKLRSSILRETTEYDNRLRVIRCDKVNRVEEIVYDDQLGIIRKTRTGIGKSLGETECVNPDGLTYKLSDSVRGVYFKLTFNSDGQIETDSSCRSVTTGELRMKYKNGHLHEIYEGQNPTPITLIPEF